MLVVEMIAATTLALCVGAQTRRIAPWRAIQGMGLWLAIIQSAALAEGGLFDLVSASKPSQLPFFGVARHGPPSARTDPI